VVNALKEKSKIEKDKKIEEIMKLVQGFGKGY